MKMAAAKDVDVWRSKRLTPRHILLVSRADRASTVELCGFSASPRARETNARQTIS